MNRLPQRAIATCAAVLAFASTSLSAQQAVARVVVTPNPATVVAGETLQLKAEAVDRDGKPVSGVRIRFQQTSASFEGTVDSTGLVHAGAVSTIPVVVSAIQAGTRPVITQIQVSVVPGPAATIDVSPQQMRLVPGQSIRANALVFSKGGDLRSDAALWTSSAPAIVRVDAEGTVSAVRAGSASITAAVGTVKRTLAVTVVGTAVRSLSITPSRQQARTGDVIKFQASVKDATGKDIAGLTPTWSMAPGKGEIDTDGAFVGYDAGTYTVTALVGGHAAQATVTLAARDVRRPTTLVGSVVRSAFATSEVWVHPNGKVAYLGTMLGGDRVYVINVADPSKPTIIDSVMVNARTINDVMTSEDGKVMVITREGADNRKNGIVLATLDDPLHPKVVGE
ncbi:MAG: Ig-like domain-containing protein, partial [Gemmatimonas sp.]